jgi:hypothetical protein
VGTAATGPVLGDLTRVEIDAVAGDIDLALPLLQAAELRQV